MTFGEKLQTLRRKAGLSQENLADRLDVSRQAVSKWERDSGYPETEKIIQMGKLFDVTLDYLLNEENTQQQPCAEEHPPVEVDGLYVRREMADGFLLYQKRRTQKLGIAAGLCIAGLAFPLLNPTIGMLLFMAILAAGALLLFSIKLAGNPYRMLRSETLSFEQAVYGELRAEYAALRRRTQFLCLTGIGLMAAGFLILPLLVMAPIRIPDFLALSAGMLLAGIGAYLCIYEIGALRAYDALLKDQN